MSTESWWRALVVVALFQSLVALFVVVMDLNSSPAAHVGLLLRRISDLEDVVAELRRDVIELDVRLLEERRSR